MKIALLGYGKMGKEVEAIALQRRHDIVIKIDSKNAGSFNANFEGADIAIDFSLPDTAISNINKCFYAHVPIVVGTTGWYNFFSEVEAECIKQDGTMFYATNYSLGVNLFMRVNSYLASLMNTHDNYNVSIEEIHHIHKLDKPSGTAITLANDIIGRIDRKKKWSITEDNSETLFIKDVRQGEVPGTHMIKYNSAVDEIEIKHTAHNRKGFAFGALLAAEFIYGKKGIFTMQDLI